MLKRRFSGAILAIAMLFAAVPDMAMAKSPVYVLAATDFQSREGETDAERDATGVLHVKYILDKMESVGGYTDFDGFLFCGDYSQNSTTEANSAGLAALDGYISERYPNCTHKVYAQGNHDPEDTVGLSPFGANDTDDYGVFVIHEDNYPHNRSASSTKTVTTATAGALKTYLADKLAQNYKKPIFIVSHLPLHYNYRTVEKNNALYGNLLYDVIDEAAEYGLNIIYMYGHNHSSTYDYFLGKNTIYLEAGDTIPVCQGATDKTRIEKLNFTYLVPGYVGYTNPSGGENLTMTVFKIENDKFTVERFSKNGRYNLKNAGQLVADRDTELMPLDTKVYTSPRTVMLNTGAAEWSVSWNTATDAACYYTENGKKGIARFIFGADLSRGKVKESGVVYVKADGTKIVNSIKGTAAAFFADIENIPEDRQGSFYAKAYCTVGSNVFADYEQTFWSDVIECGVDFTRYVNK